MFTVTVLPYRLGNRDRDRAQSWTDCVVLYSCSCGITFINIKLPLWFQQMQQDWQNTPKISGDYQNSVSLHHIHSGNSHPDAHDTQLGGFQNAKRVRGTWV